VAVLMKVYGHIYPVAEDEERALWRVLQTAITDPISADIPLLERDHDMVRISFEGLYFPLDDMLAVIRDYIHPTQNGKVDVLNIEEWSMLRLRIEQGATSIRTSPLNAVLDYSGF